MQSYIKMYYILFTQNKGFSLNTNFLEANVVNILILLFGLIYILRQFLGKTLSVRQNRVLFTIQEAEERLQKAHARYIESEKQFQQTTIVIKQIEQEAVIAAEKVRNSILAQGKLDIERLTDAGKSSIAVAERQVKEQIQQQITNLAINRVHNDLEQQINASIQSKIIDDNIKQLGGNL